MSAEKSKVVGVEPTKEKKEKKEKKDKKEKKEKKDKKDKKEKKEKKDKEDKQEAVAAPAPKATSQATVRCIANPDAQRSSRVPGKEQHHDGDARGEHGASAAADAVL